MTKDKEHFYYVNPKAPSEPMAKVYCENTTCANFIPVHQTCNLKNIFIDARGKCSFAVKRKVFKIDEK